jgi:hypothetical protein
VLVVIEDTVDILRTRHVHDSEAERMAPLISQNLSQHHRSKRDKGLTKHVIGAKVGQPADMDFGTHIQPPGKKNSFWYNLHHACRIASLLIKVAHFLNIMKDETRL